MRNLTLAFLSSALLISCGAPNPGPDTKNVEASNRSSTTPEISVEATPISSTVVKTVITTTLPLPVTVMASVDLADQAGDDVYIGHSERVTLTSPRTETLIDTSKADKPLPDGAYDVVVSFHPRWGGPDNPEAAALSKTVGQARINLAGSGTTRETAELKNERQGWVMENVVVNTPFNERDFARRLGPFEKSAATLNNHDAYYFPGADMTMIVNRSRNDIAIWRMGKATS